MTQFAKGGSIPSGKAFSGFQSKATPATPQRLAVSMSTEYGFKKRGMGSAAGAEKELQKAMTEALPVTVADMKQYTEKQLSKRASQYSGKR